MQIGVHVSPCSSRAPSDAGTVDPADIAGLTLWLDASDPDTLWQDSMMMSAATADGDPVGYWLDRSGNNNHVVQYDPTLKPALRTAIQNGKNAIRGDGVNDYIASSAGGADSAFTLFAVTISRLNGVASSPFSVGELVTRKNRMLNKPADNTIGFSGYTSASPYYEPVVNSALTWSSGTGIIAQMKHSSGYISLAKNGGAFSTPALPTSYFGYGLLPYNSTAIRVMKGGGMAYNGDVCEVLYYAAALSDGDRASVITYLNAKWSVY